MDSPLVSIVTPTLNQAKFIERTIQSVKAQTYPNLEHIVVDGGSSDGTLEILRRHEGSYDLRWLSEPDRGMYDAINKGMSLASGEIRAYLNSDDLYFPWTVSTVVDHFTRHPDSFVVFGDVINVDELTKREHFRLVPVPDLVRLQELWPLPQPSVFWRQSAQLAVGDFDASLKLVGDWEFFVRIAHLYRLDRVDEFLSIERRHASSKTISQAKAMGEEIERAVRGRAVPRSLISRAATRLMAYGARRLLWLRFIAAARRGTNADNRPWGELLGRTRLEYDVLRLGISFIPMVPPEWKAGGVRSGRDLLAGPSSWND